MTFFSSQPFLHVASIAAMLVLLTTHTVTEALGFPVLTGLIGLGINTNNDK